MVTAQQTRVNNHNSTGGYQKQDPMTSEFKARKILRLCDMVATHYPKSRVIVIIQRPAYPKDTEAEETMPSACFKKDDELDVLISSLSQVDINENNIIDSSGTEPKVPEYMSIPLNEIASVREDEYIEQEDQTLTNREQEILKYIACGETNKRIAYIVGISEQTVKCHVSSILRKLRANDRAHSVALALRNGLI